MAESKKHAYVVQDDAHAHYEMSEASPTRIRPQYGSTVDVIRREGEWALIKAFGKQAWVKEEALSDIEPPKRKRFVPVFGISYAQIPGPGTDGQSQVEYGPRGGRYTRTKNGNRRYF